MTLRGVELVETDPKEKEKKRKENRTKQKEFRASETLFLAKLHKGAFRDVDSFLQGVGADEQILFAPLKALHVLVADAFGHGTNARDGTSTCFAAAKLVDDVGHGHGECRLLHEDNAAIAILRGLSES